MRERLPTLITIFLLLALVAGTWWAVDLTQRSVEVDPPRRLTHEPDAWSKNFALVQSDATGVATNRLEGAYMNHYPDDDSYEIDQARAISNRPDNPITVATAKQAIMDDDGKRITMTGDAHVHRFGDAERKPLDVRSDVLIILPEEDVVYTDIPAFIVNGNSTMRGTGMRYNNNTRQLEVYAASDVKISGQDNQPSLAPASPDTPLESP